MPKLGRGGCGFLKKPVGRPTNYPHSIPTSQLPKVSNVPLGPKAGALGAVRRGGRCGRGFAGVTGGCGIVSDFSAPSKFGKIRPVGIHSACKRANGPTTEPERKTTLSLKRIENVHYRVDSTRFASIRIDTTPVHCHRRVATLQHRP